MASYRSLEIALSKVFNPGDEVVVDRIDFDRKVDRFFRKKATTLGIQDYFIKSGSSPRVLALIAFSTYGSDLVTKWIEEKGMPSSFLYKSLLQDARYWRDLDVRSPLSDVIVHGGDKWSFNPQELLNLYSPFNSTPGIIESMIHRMRINGEIDKVFYYMSLSTIESILERNRIIFKEEEMEIEPRLVSMIKKENHIEDLAICLCRTYLSVPDALSKMLGSAPREYVA